MIHDALAPLYRLRYKAISSLDLGLVGSYLLDRYGRDGRAVFVFGEQGTMEILLNKKERTNFLRFLHRHQPPGGLTLDQGKRVWPPSADSAEPPSASSPMTSAPTRTLDTETAESTLNVQDAV